MTFELRPYQHDILNRTRRALKHHRAVLIRAPTGSGKTALAAEMIRGAKTKGRSAAFVVHRKELIEQTAAMMDRVGVSFGYVAAGHPFAPADQVKLCGVATLASRVERVPAPDLVVWDEAHHCAAGTWLKVAAAWPKALHVGLTATPERLDGRGLDHLFTALIHGPKIEWLIKHGYLAPYRVFTRPSPELLDIGAMAGDYNHHDLEEVMNKAHLLGDAVEHYQRIIPGKSAVAFCAGIKHARALADAFNAAGVSALEIDGTTPKAERAAGIAAFRAGRVRVLTSVDLFGEGFDLPELTAAILCRPTKSLGVYMQQAGRALRAAPGKDFAYILDHAGNVAAHGLPDEERVWTLQGRPKKKGEALVKICPMCGASVGIRMEVCEYCGHHFTVELKPLEQVDGELSEVDIERMKREKKREVASASTREELEAIAKARGYKLGWVTHQLKLKAARAERDAARYEAHRRD